MGTGCPPTRARRSTGAELTKQTSSVVALAGVRLALAMASSLRSAPCRSWRDSTLHAGRAGRYVVEGERHRDARVKAHQGDHVGDADMAEGFAARSSSPFDTQRAWARHVAIS